MLILTLLINYSTAVIKGEYKHEKTTVRTDGNQYTRGELIQNQFGYRAVATTELVSELS